LIECVALVDQRSV